MAAVAYLSAVVLANLLVMRFGPAVTPLNAFLLIGLTLTLRDTIHDRTPRMVPSLIVAGGLLSALLGAGRIGLASAAAFCVSEGADAAVYHGLQRESWLRRANGSNVVGAAIDSVLFPVLAFGGFPLWVIVSQFAAKTIGGALWSWALRPRPAEIPA